MKSTFFLCLLNVGIALAKQPGIYLPFSRYFSPEPHVIGGEEAPDGAYPYMLSLRYASDRAHACGASVLTKDWALTAAHCCEEFPHEPLILVSGTNSLSQGGSEHLVEKYVMNPKYRPSQKWIYDSCLIKVKNQFPLGERVSQITLPHKDLVINDKENVNVTGWGFTDAVKETVPDKLQLAQNYVALSPKTCRRMTQLNHPSYLCVHSKKGQGVCNGDSGSPLVKNGVQVGIASFVFLPCGTGKPDIFSRVSESVEWIENVLGPDAVELKRSE